MKKIRIGHIGVSHDHSSGTLACVRKYPDVFDVIGIVEKNDAVRERWQNAPEYRDLPWMTEDELYNAGVDAVLVEGFELDLPYDAHTWLKKGVHVHMDKPAGGDIHEYEALLRLAKQKNLTVHLGYMFRYNPAWLDCLALLEEGRLGEIFEVDAIMNTAHALEKKKWLKHFAAGNMFFLGCHMADLVFRLLGTPEKITVYNRSTGIDGLDVIDYGHAVWEYPHAVATIRATSTEINGGSRRQLVVCGSKGTYQIMPLESPTRTMYSDTTMLRHHGSYSDDYASEERKLPPVAGRYDDMMLDFAAMVRGEKQNPYSYEYEYQLHRCILASCGEDIDYHSKFHL